VRLASGISIATALARASRCLEALGMRKNRFWIQVITLCAGAAFGLACALAFVGAVVWPWDKRPSHRRQQTTSEPISAW